MAFSTFRGMMAASTFLPPVTFSDTYGLEAPCGIIQGGNLGDPNIQICAGSGNTYYAVDSSNGSIYGWVVTRTTSYTKLGSPLNIVAIPNAGSGGNKVSMDKVDSTHFVMAYQDPTTNNQIDAQYITNTTGTLSVTTGQTSVATTGSASTVVADCAIVVLDTSNALVLAASNTAGGSFNVMSLINPTTLSVTQNSTTVPQLTLQYGYSYFLSKMSATRAIVSWADSTGALQLASVDVVSGTSFTCNAAVSVGFTGQAGVGASVYGISNTEALIIYRKSTTIIGARTVTVGSGGSITINTEATQIATGNPTSASAFSSIAAYGTQSYITNYRENTSGDIYSISVNVSGTTVIFDASGNSKLVSGNNATTPLGKMITVDSTHVAFSYNASTPSNVISATAYTGFVDVNPTSQTWGTFAGNNSGTIAINVSGGVSTVTGNTNALWIGTNRVFAGAIDSSSTTLKYYGFDSTAGNAAFGNFSVSPTDTSLTNGIAANALLGFASGGSGSRVLTAYASASETITTRIVTVGLFIAPTLRTAVTFATSSGSGINTNKPGYYTLVPLTADTALFLNYDNNGNYSGNIIQATTGALTIASTNTNSSIISVSGDTMSNGINFLQFSVIDSTHVAVLFQTRTTSGGKYNLKMCILSISGTTVTAGTIVNVYTGYTNTSNGFGISTLGNGTGIVWYTNDAVAPGTILYANGFTYSGTTITLGSQNSLATSQDMQQLATGNPSTIAVSGTEAIVGVVKYTTSVATLRLLTYVNINSITAGSLITTTVSTVYQFGLVPTDIPNNTFLFFGDSAYQQYYRG